MMERRLLLLVAVSLCILFPHNSTQHTHAHPVHFRTTLLCMIFHCLHRRMLLLHKLMEN
uniref:Uncharacterized protein n=1 Tax=Anopheles dirus TaxID=7168 RepID=A0A182NYB5_9DIPT